MSSRRRSRPRHHGDSADWSLLEAAVRRQAERGGQKADPAGKGARHRS